MKCEICGEPMPKGEEMFKYHGYSGPCPKPPIPKGPRTIDLQMAHIESLEAANAKLTEENAKLQATCDRYREVVKILKDACNNAKNGLEEDYFENWDSVCDDIHEYLARADDLLGDQEPQG
jgi:hypothetical protein